MGQQATNKSRLQRDHERYLSLHMPRNLIGRSTLWLSNVNSWEKGTESTTDQRLWWSWCDKWQGIIKQATNLKMKRKVNSSHNINPSIFTSVLTIRNKLPLKSCHGSTQWWVSSTNLTCWNNAWTASSRKQLPNTNSVQLKQAPTTCTSKSQGRHSHR